MKAKMAGLFAVFKGLWAKDAYQRQMTWALVGSSIAIVSLLLFYKKIFIEVENPHHPVAVQKNEPDHEEEEHSNKVYPTAIIKGITLEIPATVKGSQKEKGSLVEMEFSVECEAEETCKFIENSQVPLRDQIALILQGLDRYHFLSKEGKERVRRTLLQQLNAWLPSGKLHNLYITQLIIT